MAKLDQAQLLEIFKLLKKEMKPYEKGVMKARFDIEGKYDLWAEKQITVAGRKMDACSFAAIIVQSSYVGFYYMPIYGSDKVRAQIDPELLKCLKGKACFHIKSTEPSLVKHVREALKIGYECYKKMDWV